MSIPRHDADKSLVFKVEEAFIPSRLVLVRAEGPSQCLVTGKTAI